jgi:hypothetical protein
VALCAEISELLPAVIDCHEGLDRDARRHVDSCLRCQAELVQYRRVLRTLRSLRNDVLEPTPGLLASVLDSVGEAGERHAIRALVTGRRVAYISGLAATAAGAGAAAVVLASRSRRSRLALAG